MSRLLCADARLPALSVEGPGIKRGPLDKSAQGIFSDLQLLQTELSPSLHVFGLCPEYPPDSSPSSRFSLPLRRCSGGPSVSGAARQKLPGVVVPLVMPHGAVAVTLENFRKAAGMANVNDVKATVNDIEASASGHTEPRHTSKPTALVAAQLIQDRWRTFKRARLALDRQSLVMRLRLERNVIGGCFDFMNTSLIFIVVVLLLLIDQRARVKLKIQRHLDLTFGVGDHDDGSVSSVAGFQDFLSRVSARARGMQPLSSTYFGDSQGSVSLLSGSPVPRGETGTLRMSASPHIGPEFSITAWVRFEKMGDSGYILRKPLGHRPELSCWGWHLGLTSQLHFGAHDFRNSFDEPTVQQEVVSSAADTTAGDLWNSDAELHFHVIVVTQINASFWMDGRLLGTSALPRPVTDCGMQTLELGSPGMLLGEVNYYAKQLTPVDMQEILTNGFTFGEIAAGRLPSTLPHSELSTVSDFIQQEAAAASEERARLGTSVRVEGVLDRAVAAEDTTAPSMIIPKVNAGCDSSAIRCHVVPDASETLAFDPVTGYAYYALLSGVENSTSARRLHFDGVRPGFQAPFPSFAPTAFPSWTNRSMTLSAWLRMSDPGYVLSKHPTVAKPRCWTFRLEGASIRSNGGATVTLPSGETAIAPTVALSLPRELLAQEGPAPFVEMKALRHITLVFDATANAIRGYLDGELFDEVTLSVNGMVAALDCPIDAEGYIAMGHRAPASRTTTMDIQDLRMYVGVALTAAEIRAVANSDSSEAPRECTLKHEGYDAVFGDHRGHPCSWYESQVAKGDDVCRSSEVQALCPVACGSNVDCWEGSSGYSQAANHSLRGSVWERLMRLDVRLSVGATTCVAEGLEPIPRCRELSASGDRRYAVATDQTSSASWKGFLRKIAGEGNKNLAARDIADCDLLEASISPTCSFALDPFFVRSADSLIAAGEPALTISFWIRQLGMVGANTLSVSMAIMSSLAPPYPLAVLWSGPQLYSVDLFNRCSPAAQREGLSYSASLPADDWLFVAISLGSLNSEGERRLFVLFNSVTIQDDPIPWCEASDAELTTLVQGVVVSDSALISPIEVRVGKDALSVKQLQRRYYTQRPFYYHRIGPKTSDHIRENAKIAYDMSQFESPLSLMAPPMILQASSTQTIDQDHIKTYTVRLYMHVDMHMHTC